MEIGGEKGLREHSGEARKIIMACLGVMHGSKPALKFQIFLK